MKGLILKDLFMLKRQGKIMLALFGFYAVYSYATRSSGMIVMMFTVMCVMLPITTLALDEQNKWDRLALSMPVQRRTIVISKYVLGILLNVTATVLAAVKNLIFRPQVNGAGIEEILITSIAVCVATNLLLAIIMPLMFRFGVEKGRLMLMAVFAIPGIIVTLLYRSNIDLSKLPVPDECLLKALVFASPVIILCLLLISMNITVSIYTKKEF
jgi:ABC-2 type transport system permease protein